MTSNRPAKPTRLVAVRDDGRQVEHHLEADCGVLVGCSDTCGLSLQGEGLSRFHCMISSEDGTLWVQDWASETGTFIDDVAIDTKTEFSSRSALRIGTYVIRISSDTSPSRGSADTIQRWDAGTGNSGAAETEGDRSAVDEPEGDDGTNPFPDLASFSIADREHRPPHSPLVMDDAMFAADSYDRETVELLRAEIESLQQSLAQRDAELASMMERRYGDDAPEDPVRDDASTEAMLERIDLLIEEAGSRDHREALLQEMLRAAEEANQAECEERRQLEAWVGDLESRIAERDQHRAAELEHLQQCLQEAEAGREATAAHLRSLTSGGPNQSDLEQSLARLEQENQRLRAEVKAARAETDSVRTEQQKAGESHDQLLRQERIQLAQERAVISRLRSDLAAKLADAEHSAGLPSHSDQNADVRTRALREHLREIHAQEQMDAPQAADTLAARISRLWKRL